MTQIPLTIGPAKLQTTPAGLRIVIPVYQTWFGFLAAPFSASLAILLLRRISDLPQWWFFVLCLICVVPWARWIWRTAGRQVLTLNRVGLRLRYDLLGFEWNQEYFVNQIFKLRYSQLGSTRAEPGMETHPSYGRIYFDCGQKTERLVGRFSDTEARELIALMESYSGVPLSTLHVPAETRQDGALAEEVHRGAGGLLLFSWIGGVPYCIVMFSESSVLRFLACGLWAVMIVVGIAAEIGYRYRFTPAGLEVSTLGIRLKFIPHEKIIHYETARWMPSDGRNLPFLPSQRCFSWGGRGLRISTVDGSVYLGHKWPEKIVAELNRIKGLTSTEPDTTMLAAGVGG